MKKISLKLIISPSIKKNIIQTSVPKIEKESQKTSVSLGNLHAGNWN